MAWQHFLFEVKSGILRHEVQLDQHKWATRLNGFGSGSSSIVINPADAEPPRGGWRQETTPHSRGLVSLWDGVPWYAAPIDWRKERLAAQRMQVRHSELWKLIATGRYLWGVADYVPTATREANSLSRRGLVTLLLKWAAVDNGSGSVRWPLPIVLPGLEAGDLTRVYRAYRFEKAVKLIEQIMQEAGGPDVYLKPRINTAGRLEWFAEIGTPSVPGPTMDWQWGPEQSPIDDPSITEDATDQLTGGFALGEGSEAAMLVGKGTTAVALDLPVIDAVEPAGSIETQTQLDAYAQGFVDQRAQLQGQWDFGVRREALDLDARPGARPRLRVEGSVLHPSTDWQQLYVVAASGDLTDTVKLGVQAL